jgi:hypothetical protein
MGPGRCTLFAPNRIACCQEAVLEAQSGSNGWWFLRMPQQITVSLCMHAPTSRIFGLRAATNRAKKARSRGLPAFDSRVRRRSDQSLTLFYGFLDFASYTLTYDNAGHPGPVIFGEGGSTQRAAKLRHSWRSPGAGRVRGRRGAPTAAGPILALLRRASEGDEPGGRTIRQGVAGHELQTASGDALDDRVRKVLRKVENSAGERVARGDIFLVALSPALDL